jgi:hypothetical protein
VVQVGDYRYDLLHEILFDAQVKCLDHRPADESAHDVALLLVARHATVDRKECGCTQVVGDDTHALLVAVIPLAADTLELLNDRPHEADFVDVRVI